MRNDKETTDKLKNLEKLYGQEIHDIWNPKKKDKDYRNPRISKVQFLRQVGAARMDEWEIYKDNMAEKN